MTEQFLPGAARAEIGPGAARAEIGPGAAGAEIGKVLDVAKPVIPGGNFAALALAGLLLSACGTSGGMQVPGLSPSFSGGRVDFPTDSMTIQRIRRAPVADADVLMVEPGNVWPEQEGQRATLADPDAALRGLPRATFPDAPRQPPLERVSPRADGRIINTPDGAAVTTGGNDRVQGTISPRGPGVAIRDGGTVTIIEPGTPPRLVPAPR